jgi:molecular chaperone HtpG
VFLVARPDAAELLRPGRVLELARHYGALLPVPVRLDDGERVHAVNDTPPPWALAAPSLEAQRAAAARLGLDSFGFEPLDVVPLAAAGLRGTAFVLPEAPSPAARQGHRVYLRRMLLGEAVDGLLPEWGFFARCVIDADDLNPTAARDGLRQDARLAQAREALGRCLRDHLVGLARTDPERLAAIVAVHHLAITTLARHDDDCLALFAEWLPLETSLGRMTLGEHRRRFELLRYVRRVDDFRQLAPLAGAQGRCLVNAGYLNLAELLERLPAVRPDLATAELAATEVLDTFDDLTLEQRAEVRALVDLAALVLEPFGCAVEVRAFAPEQVPAIYVQSEAGRTRRQLGRSRAAQSPAGDWAGVLDVLAGTLPASPAARLCLNQRNRAVRALAARAGPGDATAAAAVRLLYVQALLLGHHPLDEAELALLDEAVYGLVTWAGPPAQ